MMGAIFVPMRVNRDLHDPKNKHGRFDREDGKYLINCHQRPCSRRMKTDLIEDFALG